MSVVASDIPLNASEDKIREFFSFCGKIKDIETLDKGDKSKSIKVTFEKGSAVSTALLLNGAEFEGSAIEVSEGERSGDEPEEDSSDKAGGDIDQESKPKSAIIAELLANGYVLQSSLVDKAVEFDKKQGISERFKSFIKGLDEKYHLQDKNKQLTEQTNSLYENSGIGGYWENGLRSLNTYLDKMKGDKYGSQVHDFYTKVANDAKAVNEEAKRLAELKQEEAKRKDGGVVPVINTITPNSSTADAAGAVALEK